MQCIAAVIAGDVCEVVNAKLAPHGKITRYMRGANREARLEAVLLKHERELTAKLPAVLTNMLMRARKEIITVKGQLNTATTTLKALVEKESHGQVSSGLMVGMQRLMS